jgi:hypothetical protein
MSWSAEVADAAIEDAAPHVSRLGLKGELGASVVPELAQIIPFRRIAALAQKRGLLTSVKLVGKRFYALVVVAALALGIAGSVLTSALSEHGLTAASLTLPFLAASVLAGIFALASQFLLSALRPDSTSSPLTRAAEDIAAHARSPKPSEAYQSFIDDLAGALAYFAKFRCLIVDDYTRLDAVSRKVLEVYLQFYASDSRDELWILFYSTSDKSFEIPVNRPERMSKKACGYRHTRLYQLAHLSPDQRRQLAEEHGIPERAGYLTVKAIVHDNSGLSSISELFQQEYDNRKPPVQGSRTGDTLDFFYIFALNAIPGQNPWMSRPDIRKNFSQVRKFRSQVLHALMPGTELSKTDVTTYLKRMSDSFFPLAGETSGSPLQGRFLVAPEAHEQLTASWRDFDLADPGVVHLFWTLYWTDTELRSALNVAMLPKLCRHMLASATPAEIRERLGGRKADISSFTDEFFNIAIEVLRACLRTCVLGDVPALLDYTLRLTEDDSEQVERRRRARLRPLAWQAYGLLGDERLLAVILELQVTTGQRAGAGSATRDLMYLFLESMTSADRRTRQLMRSEITRAGKHASVYARSRAGWLAVSLAPCLRTGSPSLTAAADDARDRLPAIVAESLTSLETVAEEEWRTTDILNVVLGLWSLTLASDDLRPGSHLKWQRSEVFAAKVIDALVHACLLGTDLSEQRRTADPSVANLDLVLDCLAEELLVVLLAASALVLERWPASAWSARAERAKVVDVVRESANALGVGAESLSSLDGRPARELIKDIERRMTLLTVLWRRLGFEQQASFMAIRQAQFMALSYPASAGLAESALELLPGELDRADHIGMLAHLAAAESTAVSVELTAELLARCGQMSIRSGFGDRLAAEIGLSTIRIGNIYQINFSETLDFLLARWNNGDQVRLDTLLGAIPADEMPFAINDILNTVNRDKSDRSDRVRDALERRMLSVDDAGIQKEARGQFRSYGLQRQREGKDQVDVSAELDQWEEMRDLSTYAFVLSLLLPVTPRGVQDRVMREAMGVLRVPEKYVSSTGFVYLAERVLRRMIAAKNSESEDFSAALNALKVGFFVLEKHLSADQNVNVLRLLIRFDERQVEKYTQKYIEWRKVVLELDEAQRLPQLVDQGRFFLLIWHYFQFFADFGLPSEPHMDPFGLDEQEATNALKEWRADHQATPDATVGTGKNMRLSGTFLRRGYALFFSPSDQKSAQPEAAKELEAGRREFDAAAKEAVEAVYHMLHGLPNIPRTIEQILRRHEEMVLTRLLDLEHGGADG